MNYRRTFRELNDGEFIGYLERSEELTFEAQLHLLEVAKERKLPNIDSLISTLEDHIEIEMKDVRSLKYLNHLGFSVDTSGDCLTVIRSKATRNMDVLGLLIGIVLSPNIFSAYNSIQELINNKINTVAVFVAMIFLGLSYLSAALIYRSLNRIIEYRGFQLTKNSQGSVHITKNSSHKNIDTSVSTDSLKLIGDENELSLVYADGALEVDLISTNGGIRAMETLKALHQKLI